MPDQRAETAYAKINLALHVRRRRADGYHEIETVFAFLADGDRLTVKPSQRLELDIDGPFAAGLAGEDDNLVLRAARALARHAGIEAKARLGLTKCLPVASGLGGGSADAAATLRLLNEFWGLRLKSTILCEIGLGVGADVPACVASRSAYGSGIGEKLEPVDMPVFRMKPVLLVNPLKQLSTTDVFAGWDGIDRGPLGLHDVMASPLETRNDLTDAAAAQVPEIHAILAELDAGQALLSRMSGSGASCFAIFPDAATMYAARQAIAAKWPHYWVMESAIR